MKFSYHEHVEPLVLVICVGLAAYVVGSLYHHGPPDTGAVVVASLLSFVLMSSFNLWRE